MGTSLDFSGSLSISVTQTEKETQYHAYQADIQIILLFLLSLLLLFTRRLEQVEWSPPWIFLVLSLSFPRSQR